MNINVAAYCNFMKLNNEKINYASVARQFDCDYRTVKRYFEQPENTNIERKKRVVKSKLDDFKSLIEEKAIKYHAPSISIYNLLKNDYNYKGSYSLIKKYVHELKEQKQNEVTMRFETSPGLQCQIDWKESLEIENKYGEVFEINIFLGILGYSRLKYIELTLDKTQQTLFKCLTNMFKYFNGVPKELLFDNMRTVVDYSRTQLVDPVYNQKLLQYAKDAGFLPKSCIAYRPKTKGKVETVARIMNRLKVYNKEFSTLDELKTIVKNELELINNEIQATTMEKPIIRFKKEKEYLHQNVNFSNLETYYSDPQIKRKVSNSSLVTYLDKRYSVPPMYIGKIVTLKIENNNLHIYYNTKFICVHEISNKICNYKPEHYKEIVSKTLSDTNNIDELCKQNLKLFDQL